MPDEEHFKQLIALWNHNNMRILILGMLCRTLFFYCTDEVSENELLSNKEQIQTKVASYLQILYFLKCYFPTRVKALINSQSFFFSRGTSEGLDYQSQACTAAMWSQGACAFLCAICYWCEQSTAQIWAVCEVAIIWSYLFEELFLPPQAPLFPSPCPIYLFILLFYKHIIPMVWS